MNGECYPLQRVIQQTVLPPQVKSQNRQNQPRVSQLETLEAKMANIEVSLSTTTSRRRKGGSISARSSPRPDSTPGREHHQYHRETVFQNLRTQLGLEKITCSTGLAFDDSERPEAEQRFAKLRIDAENKRIAISNLKSALEKLDITDNIDSRIKQAELEYSLGREELQLLSLVEEARALQGRLDKTKPDTKSLYGMLKSGMNFMLHAVQAKSGRWNASMKSDSSGFWVDWVLEGEALQLGDRLIEINGKMVLGKTREELQQLMNTSDKCEIVVLRRKTAPSSHQLLQKYQTNNVLMQHRISYLEDQVKELLAEREHNYDSGSSQASVANDGASNVTSISITSPHSTPPESKQVQRGLYVTTIIGGKPTKIENTKPKHSHVTTTTITKKCEKVNRELTSGNDLKHNQRNLMSSSNISINTDTSNSRIQFYQKKERDKREFEARRIEREKRYMQQFGCKLQRNTNDMDSDSDRHRLHYHRSYARSVESLNGLEKRKLKLKIDPSVSRRDKRDMNSLNVESDNNEQYASEPTEASKTRPTPPKKPLRLSLQRTQSLQTVEGILMEVAVDKKRAMKRSHQSASITENTAHYIKNHVPMQTASLERQKYI